MPLVRSRPNEDLALGWQIEGDDAASEHRPWQDHRVVVAEGADPQPRSTLAGCVRALWWLGNAVFAIGGWPQTDFERPFAWRSLLGWISASGARTLFGQSSYPSSDQRDEAGGGTVKVRCT